MTLKKKSAKTHQIYENLSELLCVVLANHSQVITVQTMVKTVSDTGVCSF